MVSQQHLGFDNPLALFQVSEARNSEEKFKQDQLEALPSIAELVEVGKIEIFTSTELAFELLRNLRYPIFTMGDLLDGSVCGEVSVPISRAGRGNIDPFDKDDGNRLIEFVRWLLDKNYVGMLLEKPEVYGLTEFEISNLKNIGVFRDICNPIAQNHYGDAFHLWTATVNQMDFFLTSDKKFYNVVTQNRRKRLKCPPIFPTEFTKLLGVKKYKPLPFEYGEKYFYNGLKYD